MSKKVIFLALGVIAFVAAAVMYSVGTNNSNLTELLDYYWLPIPLGILFVAIAFKKTDKSSAAEPPASDSQADTPPASVEGSEEQEN